MIPRRATPAQYAASAAISPTAELLPFTCQYCRNTLADHLLVYDFYAGGSFSRRVKDLVCGGCGLQAIEDLGVLTEHAKAVRMFRLMPTAGGAR